MPKKKIKDRKKEFIKLVASGIAPYKACIEAGYSEKYAHSFSHILCEKYENEIDELKPKAKEILQKEFSYTVQDSYNMLCEIQKLALLQNEKGNFNNLNAAIKAEELKGKLNGLYQADNEQKANNFEIMINRKSVDVKGND